MEPPKPPQSPQQPVVFVLAGQSDMVGRGNPTKLPQDLVDSVEGKAHSNFDFRMCNDLDKLAREGESSVSDGFVPLGRNAQWSNAGGTYSHGPEWGMAAALLDAAGIEEFTSRVYFIKFAMGSSSLQEDWNANGRKGSYFPDFIVYVKKMLGEIRRLESQEGDAPIGVTGLLWLQGHTDASGRAEMRENYGENFARLVSRFREEMGSSDIPVVASQLTWQCREGSKSDRKFRKAMMKVNDAISQACSRGTLALAAFSSYDEETEKRMTCLEDGHSDTEGLLLLGELMMRSFLQHFGECGRRRMERGSPAHLSSVSEVDGGHCPP